ncbi:MlaE family ABC transporter permease [Ahrensia kielensis]|uniref:MlaE family ABC transporter permease n=1 Tax=Ahrensia kielensis TaxID=76980 RepID=UPI0005A73A7E
MTRTNSTILKKGSAISSLSDQEIRLPSFSETSEGDTHTIVLDGVWATHSVGKVDKKFKAIKLPTQPVRYIIDCADITMLDTAGAWMISRLKLRIQDDGNEVEVLNLSKNNEILLDAVMHAVTNDKSEVVKPAQFQLSGILAAIGKMSYSFAADFMASMNLLGAAVRGSHGKTGQGRRMSFAPIASQIDKMGVGAIPIIVLMSVIMGAIIAQQGAFQLRYFGAEIFVVDLVGILVLREIGVILTAIMIAGRSGSAITAEIGSMKMREEVDALKVIGLNPISVLILPRLVALVISLPLLTFVANMAALGGAMIVAQTYSGISPDAFMTRVREAVDMTSFFAGIIKAPFMAIIIGIIASVEGMKVEGSAESLGRRVTSSVVKSIFVVIVVDGLFAIFFAAVDF